MQANSGVKLASYIKLKKKHKPSPSNRERRAKSLFINKQEEESK